MDAGLSPIEKRIAQKQSPLCDRVVPKGDLILSYPSKLMSEAHADIVARPLQRAMDYLKYVTGLNPTRALRGRVTIRWIENREVQGKSRWKSEKDTNGDFIGSWVDLSWDYMFKPCEPFRICGHELAHPFFRISPLHQKNNDCVGNGGWLGNEGWGEGFCDFMRGPMMNCMRLPGQQGDEWWQKMIQAARNKQPGTHHNPAGQIVLKYLSSCRADRNSFSRFIHDKRLIKGFISDLFKKFACCPLKSELTPTDEMIRKYGHSRL